MPDYAKFENVVSLEVAPSYTVAGATSKSVFLQEIPSVSIAVNGKCAHHWFKTRPV